MASDRDTLPTNVKPSNYNLSLFDLKFVNDWSYQGILKIDLDIQRDTNEIVLNTDELKIHGAELLTEQSKTEQKLKTSNISYDVAKQRSTLQFDQQLTPGSKAVLEIRYEGIINNSMAGFYRSKYAPTGEASPSVPHDDEHHYMFSTQFESCSARRAFPCFDEPNLKASFEFEIEIPKDQVALSNMPQKVARKSSKPDWNVVSFEKSPKMSTYLFTWALGDFEYVEHFTERKYDGKNIPVRVYTTRGLKEQGQWALSVCHKVVDYFSTVFQIDYPLPKVDLLSVHEFSHGAMEGWGLITYRTTALLFDEKSSDQRYKQRVAYVVSHELAHQWFGNLVTMDWWNELWLNEGFATWVGWLAVHHLHPEWNVWAQFCAESMHSAFNLDSIRKSHPIEVPVQDALEVEQIFDAISYLKGSSVIRMLSAHIGTEVFLQGVCNYLKKHTYSNAKTEDLWDALSKVSGQDINALMEPWIKKIGFPVVTVTEDQPGQILIKQSRFLLSGDVEAQEDETVWWIPLGLQTSNQKTNNDSSQSALKVRTDTIQLVDDSFYKLNTDSTGFYRTNYQPARLQKLGESNAKLTTSDNIGLVGDAAALAQSGNSTTAAFLALIENFSNQTDYRVWSQILVSLSHVKSIFGDDAAISAGLKNFTLKLVDVGLKKVGWEFAPNEDHLIGMLRGDLITHAGRSGNAEVIAEAQKRFNAFASGTDEFAIHPSLRLAIFRVAQSAGGAREFEEIKKFYHSTTSVDGKDIALVSMGTVPTTELAVQYLDFVFSPAVKLQDKLQPFAALSRNSAQRHVLWDYMKKNWDNVVCPQLSANFAVMERAIKMGLDQYTDFAVEKDIGKFFADKNCQGFDRGISVARDTILGAAKYKARDAEKTKSWLKDYGYLSSK